MFSKEVLLLTSIGDYSDLSGNKDKNKVGVFTDVLQGGSGSDLPAWALGMSWRLARILGVG